MLSLRHLVPPLPRHRCDHCGSYVQDEKASVVFVDLAANTVHIAAHAIRLTPRQSELMSILVNAMPRAVSADNILNLLVAGCDEGPAAKCLHVWVCKLRKLFRGTGLEILTHWGSGFSARYSQPDEPEYQSRVAKEERRYQIFSHTAQQRRSRRP